MVAPSSHTGNQGCVFSEREPGGSLYTGGAASSPAGEWTPRRNEAIRWAVKEGPLVALDVRVHTTRSCLVPRPCVWSL